MCAVKKAKGNLYSTAALKTKLKIHEKGMHSIHVFNYLLELESIEVSAAVSVQYFLLTFTPYPPPFKEMVY